jgi:surfactin synthase thioesterase subunit
MKLIVFPHAGGFSNFYEFMKNYPFEYVDEVYLYEYPGRGKKYHMPMGKSVRQLARTAALELEHVIRAEPYALFGHSMGAFVAFEASVYLQKMLGRKAELLVVSGQQQPYNYTGVGVDFHKESTVIDYLKEMGGTDELILSNQEARSFFLPMIQNDLIMAEEYTFSSTQQEKRCKNIAVLYGREDNELTEENTAGWEAVGEKYIGAHVFRGGHFYMNEEQNKLNSYLDKLIKKCTLESVA